MPEYIIKNNKGVDKRYSFPTIDDAYDYLSTAAEAGLEVSQVYFDYENNERKIPVTNIYKDNDGAIHTQMGEDFQGLNSDRNPFYGAGYQSEDIAGAYREMYNKGSEPTFEITKDNRARIIDQQPPYVAVDTDYNPTDVQRTLRRAHSSAQRIGESLTRSASSEAIAQQLGERLSSRAGTEYDPAERAIWSMDDEEQRDYFNLRENYGIEAAEAARGAFDKEYGAVLRHIRDNYGLSPQQYAEQQTELINERIDDALAVAGKLRKSAFDNPDNWYYDADGRRKNNKTDEIDATIRAIKSLRRDLNDSRMKYGDKDGWSVVKRFWAGGDLIPKMLPVVNMTRSLERAGITVGQAVAAGKMVDDPTSLTSEQQLLHSLTALQQSVGQLQQDLGGKHWASSVGEVLSEMPEFMIGMPLAKGATKAISKGASRALNSIAARSVQKIDDIATRALNKVSGLSGVGGGIMRGTGAWGKSFAESVIGAPTQTLFYKMMADEALGQYVVRPDGSTTQIITPRWQQLYKAWLNTALELHSEDMGMWIGKGLNTLGRRMANIGFARGLMRVPASRSPFLETLRKEFKVAGPLSEAAGEVYGDAIEPLFTGELDWSETLADEDYWKTTVIASAGVSVALDLPTIPQLYRDGEKIREFGVRMDAALENIANDELRSQLVAAASRNSVDAQAKAFANIDWANASREDMAAAMDYVSFHSRRELYYNAWQEMERQEQLVGAFNNTLATVYRGADGFGSSMDIIIATPKNGSTLPAGNKYFILGGDYTNPEGFVSVRREDNGKFVSDFIPVSQLDIAAPIDAASQLAEQYENLFSNQIAEEQVTTLSQRIDQMRAEGVGEEEIREIVSENPAYHEYKEGDVVTDSQTGEAVTIEENTATGEYVARKESGERIAISYDQIADSAAYAQQAEQAERTSGGVDEGDIVSFLDRDNNIIEGEVRQVYENGQLYVAVPTVNANGEAVYVSQVISPNQVLPADALPAQPTPTEQAVQEVQQDIATITEPAPVMVEPTIPTNAAPDPRTIPTLEDGSIDYDAIDDPQQFIDLYGKNITSEELVADVTSFRDDAQQNVERLQNEVASAKTPNEKKLLRDQINIESNRAAKYQAVLDLLTPATPIAEQTEAVPTAPEVAPVAEEQYEIGPFGKVYRQFKGKAKEAIQFLLDKKDGEAIGALSHPEIGEIDLVWGEEGTGKSDGYGLSKLAKYHPEVLDNLQEIINDMHVTSRSANRVHLESDTHQAAVRLTWDNESKNWLLTAFEKKNSAFDNTTDTGETLKEGKQNDTATLQNTVSESKDTTTEPKKQEVAQENLQPTPQSTAEEQMEVSPVENKDADEQTALSPEERAAQVEDPSLILFTTMLDNAYRSGDARRIDYNERFVRALLNRAINVDGLKRLIRNQTGEISDPEHNAILQRRYAFIREVATSRINDIEAEQAAAQRAAEPEWLQKVPTDGRNFMVYTKVAGENSYSATDLKTGQAVGLVYASLVKRDRLQSLVEELPKVLLEGAHFQIRDTKGKIYYSSEPITPTKGKKKAAIKLTTLKTVSGAEVKVPINLYKYVSTDKTRAYTGVYFDPEGFVVATDGHNMIAVKHDVAEADAEKFISKSGDVASTIFNWRIAKPKPNTEKPINVDFVDVEKQIGGKKGDKFVAFEIDGQEVEFPPKAIHVLADFQRAFGGQAFVGDMTAGKAIVIRSGDNYAIALQTTKYADLSQAIHIPSGIEQTTEQVEQPAAVSEQTQQPTEPTKQEPKPKRTVDRKIEDYGEKIAGARKDILRNMSKNFDNATIESLVALPFAKAFVKPDLKKLVEAGVLRPDDAKYAEAIMWVYVNKNKPKARKTDVWAAKRGRETRITAWAKKTFDGITRLRDFIEADEATRDELIAQYGQLGEQIKAEEDAYRNSELGRFNAENNNGYGELYSPNPITTIVAALDKLNYQAGDKITFDAPIVKAEYLGRYFNFENQDGEKVYAFSRANSIEEAIDTLVLQAKIRRGDTDIQYPIDMFSITREDPIREPSGMFTVYHMNKRGSLIPETVEGREAAEKKVADYQSQGLSADLREEKKVVGYATHRIRFKNRLTDVETIFDEKFGSEGEARQALEERYDEFNDLANDYVASLSKQKREQPVPFEVTTSWNSETRGVKYVVKNTETGDVMSPQLDTRKEAEEYYKNHIEEWKAKWQEMKDARKKFVFFDDNVKPREGKDYRNGRDVTAEDLATTFGFRGIQFGNWTNDADRQAALNQAYDAFMDLADILGVSPKALSLAGELGIAFGARGGGSALAHYEPDEIVINLTKTKGAGSLAHEWWHALDNYFSRQGNIPMGFVTSNPTEAKMREEMRAAWQGVVKAVKGTEYAKRSMAQGDYWGRMLEMTARLFGEWTVYELAKTGRTNHFLSRGITPDRFDMWRRINYAAYKWSLPEDQTPMPFEEFALLPRSLKGMPFPTKEETEQMGEAVRNLFDVVQEKVDEQGNVVLFQRGDFPEMPNTEANRRAYKLIREKLRKKGIEVHEVSEEQARQMAEAVGAEYQIVYHGSGAKFDRFDHSFIGTGEGAQAYGWGTYVTQVEGIGKTYAKNVRNSSLSLSYKGVKVDTEGHYNPWRIILDMYNDSRGKLRDMRAKAERYESLAEDDSQMKPVWKEVVRILKDDVRAGDLAVAPTRVLYSIEIPDSNGEYLQWDKNVNKYIRNKLIDSVEEGNFGFWVPDHLREASREARAEYWMKETYPDNPHSGEAVYNLLRVVMGSDRAASAYLRDNGFVGIEYPAQYQSGGREDNAKNYVIFNENDLKIIDRVELFQDSQGKIYGWAVGGEIYLTPDGLNANTAIHEYSHLWVEALRKKDSKKWAEIKSQLQATPFWQQVIDDPNYERIRENEDAVASEVLARLTGKNGAERLAAEAQRIIDAGNGSLSARIEATALVQRIKRLLRDLWAWVARNIFGVTNEATISQLSDMVVDDLLDETPLTDAENSPFEAMFIGELGANTLDIEQRSYARMNNLDVATQMEEAGKSPFDVKIATGWERGADGEWRYEISDAKAHLNLEGMSELNRILETNFREGFAAKLRQFEARYPNLAERRQQLIEAETNSRRVEAMDKIFGLTPIVAEFKLRDLFDYEDAYEAYPELKNYDVRIIDRESLNGSYYKGKFDIALGVSRIPARMRAVLLHEIQHAIQEKEGFAAGGNPEMFMDFDRIEYLERRRDELNQRINEGEEGLEDELQEVESELVDKREKEPYYNYRRLAGEVEARNVMKRRDMTAAQRRTSLATSTEDFSRDEQLVRARQSDDSESLSEESKYSSRVESLSAVAHDVAAKLNAPIQIITDMNDVPRARQSWKGWWQRGESGEQIVVVVPNNIDAADIERTILHEAVAHYGLRKLLGESRFNLLLDTVLKSMSEEEVQQRMRKYSTNDPMVVADEYIAEVAEGNVTPSMFERVVSAVRAFLRDVLGLSVQMTDNDIRYLLWQSKNALEDKSAFGRAMVMAEGKPLADIVAEEYGYARAYTAEEQQIIDDAQRDGTYLKAPNDKPTSLTPKQWVQVRTKAFKRWFGDWEKAARIEKLRNSKNVSILGDEFEMTADPMQNRKNAIEFSKSLRGEYTNKDTGAKIVINSDSFKEVLHHDIKNDAHVQSIAAVPDMVENGIYITSEPISETSSKRLSTATAMHYYVCGLEIGGTPYTAKFVVAELANGERYYDHSLTQIEKGDLLNRAEVSSTVADNKSPLSEVKDKRLISILQTSASKIVDANGEPMVVWHRTPNNFTSFDVEKIGSSTDWGAFGMGFYFSADPEQYRMYGQNKLAVFLNAKNPLQLTADNAYEIKAPFFGGDYSWGKESSEKFTEWVKSSGYDSVVYIDNGYGVDEYVVYSPTQIKSAEINSGEFDPTDPDIRARRTSTQYVDEQGTPVDATPIQKMRAVSPTLPFRARTWLGKGWESIRRKIQDSQSVAAKTINGVIREVGERELARRKRKGTAMISKRELAKLPARLRKVFDGGSADDVIARYKKRSASDQLVIAMAISGFNATVDYLSAENRSESQGEYAMTQYIKNYIDPMNESRLRMRELMGVNDDQVEAYVSAESSLERHNSGIDALSTKGDDGWTLKTVEGIVISFRQRLRNNIEFKIKSEGVNALTEAEREVLGEDIVRQLTEGGWDSLGAAEQMAVCEAPIEVLWERIRKVNDEHLNILLRAGRYTHEDIERIKSHNWKYYVPLFGINYEAEGYINPFDVYDFDAYRGTANAPSLSRATGRNTRSQNVFRSMYQLGQRCIAFEVRNRVAQTLYDFTHWAADRLGVPQVASYWQNGITYQTKTASGKWQDEERMLTRDEMEQVRDLEREINSLRRERLDVSRQIDRLSHDVLNTMGEQAADVLDDALRGLVSRRDELLNKIVELEGSRKWRAKRSHFSNETVGDQKKAEVERKVRVWVNGREHSVIFNDPAIARAVNMGYGTNKFWQFVGAVTRFRAQLNTQFSPDFIVSNTIRDFQHALLAMALAEQDGVMLSFAKNYFGRLGDVYRSRGASFAPLTEADMEGRVPYFSEERMRAAYIASQLRGEKLSEEEFEQQYHRKVATDREALIEKFGAKRVMDTLMDAFNAYGGATGFIHALNAKQIEKQFREAMMLKEDSWLRRYVDPAKPFVAVRDAISRISETMEDNTRFATFLSHLDNGASVEQAAQQAKEVTTNFNRRGEWSSQVGSLYMFFNASMQGSSQIMRLIKHHPTRAAWLLPSYAALGFVSRITKGLSWKIILGTILKTANWDWDDDDKPRTLEQMSGEKDIRDYMYRDNLIITLYRTLDAAGQTIDGMYLRLPQPNGFRAAFKIGVELAESVMGEQEWRELPWAITADIAGEFLYGYDDTGDLTSDFFKIFWPTPVQPFTDLAANRDFVGRKIYPDRSYNPIKPSYQMAKRNTAAPYVWASMALNSLLGSDTRSADYNKQFEERVVGLDVPPEALQYLVGEIFGGVGTFANRAYVTAQLLTGGELPSMRDVPLLNRALGEYEEVNVYEDYYNFTQSIENAWRSTEQFRKDNGIDMRQKEWKNPNDTYPKMIEHYQNTGNPEVVEYLRKRWLLGQEFKREEKIKEELKRIDGPYGAPDRKAEQSPISKDVEELQTERTIQQKFILEVSKHVDWRAQTNEEVLEQLQQVSRQIITPTQDNQQNE